MTPSTVVARGPVIRRPSPPLDHYRARPLWIIFLPFLATVSGGAAWLFESRPLLNFGWILVVMGCGVGIAVELRDFRYRLGVGGLVLWGGTLIWLCQDYFARFFLGGDAAVGEFWGPAGPSLGLIIRASFYHFLLVTLAAVGLRARPRFLAFIVAKVPPPARKSGFLALIVVMFVIGLLPYFVLTVDPWYESLWKSFTSMRGSGGVRWVVRRSGNLNFSWGGYYQQWLRIGTFGSLLAGFYALFLARRQMTRLLCWAMWIFALAIAFGSGTRGEIIFVGAPILGMAFIRYHLQNRHRGGLYSVRAYAVVGAVVVAFYVMMQIQGVYRQHGLAGATVTTEMLESPLGNEMFSSSLVVFQFIPGRLGYVYAESDLEGWFRAVPQTVFDFFIGPIPRALWRGKPIDESWEWVNRVVAGTGVEGTTISKGIVGFWYAKYGPGGVFTGALFWGWLFALLDMALWRSRQEPIRVLILLCCHAFMFRTFRDIFWHELYPVLIGVLAYSIVAGGLKGFKR